MITPITLDKLEFQKVLNQVSNYSITEKGKQLIQNIKPVTDKEFINREGETVNQAKEILIKSVPPPIEFIPDLTETILQSKIEGSVLNSKKILQILNLAATSRKLYKFIKDNSEQAPLLTNYNQELFIDKMFEHHIQNVIDDNGEVKEKASKKLSRLRKDIRDKQGELIKSINRIMKSLEDQEMVREDYLTLRDGRMVIPIKVEHKRHLRGFIHSESATGQTVYIEPEQTLELNNEIISLNFAERREIERLLKEITNLIGKESEKLKVSLDTVAYIDSIFARAKHSIEVIGSFPSIDDKNPFYLNDARHPVLQKKLGRKESVPLNLKLSGEKVIILTGPNAGGKTVVLKTIGLLSLLLQSGIHIPASPDSNIHIFENILIDIGDEQSIEDDLSTFTSHLGNIRNILESADKNTLVLLDEIGTGTDPAEGSALAAATLLKLRDMGALVFASTHHGNLKLMAQDEEGFANAAMEFDHEKLTPTYKFIMGVPGSSYAFEIAKRIGISEELLRSASENMEIDKYKIEKFLVDIEAKSTRLEKKLKDLELENIRLSGLSNLYKKNVEKLENEKKEILNKAKSEADLYLVDINKKIEKVIKDLRESKAAREVIKESKKIVEEIKQKNENLFTPDVVLKTKITDFNIGSFVSLRNTSASGKIIELDKQKKRATIQVGTMKMKVELDEILPAKENKTNEPLKSYPKYKIPETQYRLDIRGKKPEEADFEIVKFIDNSFMAGHNRIEILHGKGTGALKRTVKEILDKHDSVKDYYFAPIESGGEGITIVELK